MESGVKLCIVCPTVKVNSPIKTSPPSSRPTGVRGVVKTLQPPAPIHA